MQAVHELAAKLKQALEPREEILEAYLFGSAARGDAAPHSDIDVAVYVRAGTEADARFGEAAEIATALMQARPAGPGGAARIDVVLLNQAPPLLYHRVLRDGIRLLSRDLRATTVREGRALSRYCDYLPQLRKIDQAYKARLRAGAFGR